MSRPEKLTFRQLRAIHAMLSEDSLEAAAKKAGVHVKTLKTWRRNSVFQSTYQRHADRLFEFWMTSTVHLFQKSIATLEKSLEAEKASDRIRAAVALTNCAIKSFELKVLRKELADFMELKRLLSQNIKSTETQE